MAMPRVAVAPHPPMAPQPAYTPSPDASFDQRLRRLEALVQTLIREQDPKRAARDRQGEAKGWPGATAWVDQDEMKTIQEKAERQAARAAEQIDRANREMEKALSAQKGKAEAMKGDTLKHHVEALQKHREMLEREMEKLQQQIERIEQQQEKLQEGEGRRGDLRDDNEDHEAEVAALTASEDCAGESGSDDLPAVAE